MGHFLSQDVQSWGDWIAGSAEGIGATMTGLTGGGFDYGEAGRHFKNWGYDVKNAFTGSNERDEGPGKPPPSLAQIRQANLQRAIDPNAPWNKVNWEAFKDKITNPRYSSEGGLSGVPKPSNIMAISDPASKMNIATTRGNARSALNAAGAVRDAQSANILHQVNNSSNEVQQASNNTTGAGGVGLRTSSEQGQNSFQH